MAIAPNRASPLEPLPEPLRASNNVVYGMVTQAAVEPGPGDVSKFILLNLIGL